MAPVVLMGHRKPTASGAGVHPHDRFDWWRRVNSSVRLGTVGLTLVALAVMSGSGAAAPSASSKAVNDIAAALDQTSTRSAVDATEVKTAKPGGNTVAGADDRRQLLPIVAVGQPPADPAAW